MEDVHARIITTLSGHDKSLMIKEIAQLSGLHPQTVARNLDVLEVLGRVRKIQMGHAKKYYLTEAIPISGLIDLSSDLIIILNQNHQVQYINNAAEKFLNLSSHPVVGERLEFLNLDIFSSPLVLEGLKQFTPDKIFRTTIAYERDGVMLWHSVSILNLALKINSRAIAIVAEDITAEKRAEEILKEREAKYRLISDNVQDVISLFDHSSGKLQYVSPSVYHLIGYTPDELMNKPALSTLTTDSIHRILDVIHTSSIQSTDERISAQTLRIDHIHKNGSLLPAEMVITLLSDPSGKVNEVICVTRNISERVRVETELQKTREYVTFLADILQRSSQPFVTANSEGKLFSWNNAFEDLVGYSSEEIQKINWICDLTPLQWIKSELDVLAKLRKSDQSVRYEKEYIRKDGSLVPIELNTHLLQDRADAIAGFYAFITDISDRKKAEEKVIEQKQHLELLVQDRTRDLLNEIEAKTEVELSLRDSEERFLQIADYAKEWIWEIDTNGVYQYCSPAVESILGYAPAELIERSNFWDHFIPELRDEMKNNILSMMEKQEIFRSFVNPLLGKNNSIVIVETSFSVVRDTSGNLTGYRGVHRDVTESMKNIDALRSSEMKYRLITEYASDMIFQLASDGKILFVTPSSYKLLNYKPEEIIGKSFIELISIDSARDVWNTIISVNASGSEFRTDHLMNRKDGSIFWVESSFTFVKDDSGTTQEIHCVVRDISERKGAEDSLLQNQIYNRLLYNDSPIPLVLFDPESWEYLDLNNAALKLYEYSTKEEVIGKKIGLFSTHTQYDGTDSVIAIRHHINNCLAHGTDCFDWRYQKKNGEIWHGHVCLSLFHYTGKKLILFSFQDLTEQKNAEIALMKSEARYKTLVQYAPDAIVVYDVDRNRLIDANPAAERLFGRCDEEITWIDSQKFPLEGSDQPLSPTEIIEIRINRAIAGEEVIFEQSIINTKGEKQICEVRLVKFPSEHGNLIRVSCIDITQRKETELALREREELFWELFNESPIGFFILDPKGKILEANQFALEMFGMENAVGFDLNNDPNVSERIKQGIKKGMVVQSEIQYNFDLIRSRNIYPTKKQGFFYTSTIFSPLHAEGNEKVTGYIFNVMDITDQKLTETKGKQAIEQINQILTTLSVLNDQIRNPLTIIACLIDDLPEDIKNQILLPIKAIDTIIDKLDQGWVESDKVRKYLLKHYGVTSEKNLKVKKE